MNIHCHPPALCALVFSLALAACAQAPLHLSESDRTSLGNIGVLSTGSRPQVDLLLPAKGPVEGAWRGAGSGVKMAIYGGLFSPIPGGVIIGALLSPFFAAGGAIYGATVALPRLWVDRGEQKLRAAAGTLQLNRLVREQAVQYALRKTRHHVVDLGTRHVAMEKPPPLQTYAERHIDTLLLIEITEFATRDAAISSPFDIQMTAGTRLIRVADGREIANGHIRFTSRLKPLKIWIADDSALFRTVAERGARQVGEEIVFEHLLAFHPVEKKANPQEYPAIFYPSPEPVSPREDGMVFDSAAVDSLSPEFCWRPVSSAGRDAYNHISYRLRILDHSEVIYVQEGLKKHCHRIGTELEADTEYSWTIEAWFESAAQVRASRSAAVKFHTPAAGK